VNPSRTPHPRHALAGVLSTLSLASALLLADRPATLTAQDAPKPPDKPAAEAAPATAPPTAAQPATVPAPANPAPPAAGDTNAPAPPTDKGATGKSEPEELASSDEIQLSFQGANIDMISQWLAKSTGKSVVKHPKVQCQITIVSSKKLMMREAVNLVYRALSLEGFTIVESSKSILIVPEGQEPKTSPELMDGARGDIPEGRQRLVKIFPLKHVQATDLKERVRGVLTEKASIDADERANQLIVTDYTDNIRLLADLLKELDVVSVSDIVVEIFPLKHSEAEELSNLLGLVLNAQAGGGAQGMPGQPMPGQPMPGQPMPGQPMPGQPMPGRPGMPGGQPAGQQVKFWPDRISNRLIVSAPRSKMAEVRKLLDILDAPKPRDVAIRVIPLKHVNAEDIARELTPLYQKLSGKSLKEIIEVTADTRSNSLIVLASENNFKVISDLITSLDTEEAQEKVMQAFPLSNADAEDVAKQLEKLSQDQDSSSRYPYYFFSSSMSRGASRKLSVVADRRRNTVIVQAPPAAMPGIAKMIKNLDEPVSDNTLAPKIFALKYVSAVDIEDVLNELFLKRQTQRPYWYYYESGEDEPANRDVGRLYGKVRITSEPYSNSIIVTANSAENLAAVEEVLKKLDVPSQAGETTMRVGLKFAKALAVANSVNILFARGGSPPLRQVPQQGQPVDYNRAQQPQARSPSQANFELELEGKEEGYFPWLGGPQESSFRSSDSRNSIRPVSDLVGRVRVVPDARSNSLLITCNVHFFPQIMKLIEDLDAPTAQVLIEAKIIEVSSDFRDRLGVRWSPEGRTSFDSEDLENSVTIGTKGDYKKGFGGQTTAAGGATVGAGAALVNALRSGVLESTVSLDLLIQFLRKNTDSKILAEPQINIADNELGRLFVGAQVPYLTLSSLQNTGARNDSYDYKNVGIILEVTPHINNAREVMLRIRTESSSIRSGQTILGGAIFDTRNFRTDLMVQSGQTLVLGGIIQREDSDVVRKVPVLGSIPVLGWAFKKKDKVSREVELMVFLRPRVTRTPEEARELLREIDGKAPGIKDFREQPAPEIKGPEKPRTK
jgi:type II secretion system protein D